MKTILVTGSTDGIGLETVKALAKTEHHILLHGRNKAKLDALHKMLSKNGSVDCYLADLSSLDEVQALADEITKNHDQLDVLINNAGILKTPKPVTDNGLDVRFVVNTFAPYVLTKRLLPLFTPFSRVINLSSAAQAPVNLEAMAGKVRLADMEAYAQSKLAITMWSRLMASEAKAPIVIAVNPGSLLASNMVRTGFGIEGKDVTIGSNILCHLALEDRFESKSGLYFDNDIGDFGSPHPDALNQEKSNTFMQAMQEVLHKL